MAGTLGQVFQAPDGYAPIRKTIPRAMLTVRYMTPSELKALSGHAHIIANDGTVRNVKVTSVKVWKTRPNDVEIGVKYGMYEYAKFTMVEALTRFVVVLADSRDGQQLSTPDGTIRA